MYYICLVHLGDLCMNPKPIRNHNLHHATYVWFIYLSNFTGIEKRVYSVGSIRYFHLNISWKQIYSKYRHWMRCCSKEVKLRPDLVFNNPRQACMRMHPVSNDYHWITLCEAGARKSPVVALHGRPGTWSAGCHDLFFCGSTWHREKEKVSLNYEWIDLGVVVAMFPLLHSWSKLNIQSVI